MRAAAAAASAAVLIAFLCAGIYLGGHPDALPGPVRDLLVDEQVSLTAEAADVIEDNYWREVPESELREASVNGMVDRLRRKFKDNFSHYFSPDDLERFETALSGRFTGVGLSVTEVKRGLRIAKVYPGTPAREGGLKAGEIIVAVNGKTIAGQDSELVTTRIKGPAGTDVDLGILDPTRGKRRSVTLTRAEITVPITVSRVRDVGGRKLGYVGLATFSEVAVGELREAVQRVRRKGAKGLVLDLRGNGGGLLRQAILTSALFVPEDEVIVSTKSRTQGEQVYRSPGGALPRQPTVVLINRDTASAAEILTAALAEDGGATVVGTRSFGKGVFQQVIDLANGGALDLTIGEYFTASGESLTGKGIKPDIRAEDVPRTRRDEALERAFAVLAGRIRETR